MESHKTYKFMISGGGTGGHIFPALAIANELKSRLPKAEFLFVGANGKMEMDKVPAAGYEIKGLPITGIQRKFSWSNVLFPFRLIKSMQIAGKLLKTFQPDVVIGTGGFASGPTLIAAQNRKFKTVIQEQNSLPGITNKQLGKKAQKIFVSYENMNQYFPSENIENTGNPIRSELFTTLPSKEEAKKFFGLTPNKQVILSVGGSLGSRTLNNVWRESYTRIVEGHFELLWQTGKLEFNDIPDFIKNQDGIVVKEFIHRMDMAYAAADVIVSRAGAIAISELAIIGKPMILVPYPYAAEDHQTKNAKALESAGAAKVIADDIAQSTLANTAISLLQNKQMAENLASNTKQFAKPNATQNIVSEILKLIEA